ncbi:MAG: ferredoxin, partial [Promethearchaeota archaeon]
MSNTVRKRTIRVCRGTGCNSLGAEKIHEELIKLIEANNLSEFINIKLTGCHGFCQIGPTFIIDPDNILYANLKVGDIKDIVDQHLLKNKIVERLLYKDPSKEIYVSDMKQIQFYANQSPIITNNCGVI